MKVLIVLFLLVVYIFLMACCRSASQGYREEDNLYEAD